MRAAGFLFGEKAKPRPVVFCIGKSCVDRMESLAHSFRIGKGGSAMTTVGVAQTALEEVRVAQARMAQKVACPPYKHALFGALLGSVVAAQAGPPMVVFGVEALVMLAAAVMFVLYRRKTGFFVNGYRKGRTRPVVIGLIVFYVAALGAAGWFKATDKLAWPALVLGLLMFCVGTWASLVWQQVYQRELDPTLGGSA
jgi:hypothetical protein